MPEYVSGPQNMPKSHLTDYETQLKLLEEQNQKRLSMARKQQQERIDSAIKTEEPLESSQGAPASAPCRRQLRQLEITSRKRLAMARDEQEPVNDGRATESPIPEIDTSWPSEPTAGTHVLLGYQRALAQFNQQGGKRLKLEPIPDYQTHFHNRARALYPDVTPQTEDRTQIQENGWAESPMDRENSVSTFFATPEGTPEAEQMHMSDVNFDSRHVAEKSQRSRDPTTSPTMSTNSTRLPSIREQLDRFEEARPLVIRGKLPDTTSQ
jgi:hypothetical protein